jgi:hypothetical protein
MWPLLFDEGLPAQIAEALRTLELDAQAIGDPGAPPRGSDDEDNIKWCKAHGAILVTNDRGKKDKTILDHLASYHVHAIFVHADLRAAEPHRLASALLHAEGKIDDLASSARGLIRHRLRTAGGLEKR